MGGRAVIGAIQSVIVLACGVAIVLISSVCIAAGMCKAAMRAKRRLRGASLMFCAFAVACILFGGRKGSITVSDPYVVNNGSYLTNDVVHVAIAKRSAMLPDNTAILVYARQLEQTNATDWVRLMPHLTYVDHPYDYSLPNATNYNVMVDAQFTPSPTVHTNGVWSITGFIIPNSGGRMGFKQTRTILIKEDNEE